MDKIVCYIDSMSMKQKVLTPDNKEQNIDSATFAETMVGMCNAYGVNKIHLFGNKYFIDGVMEEISTKEAEKYSTKNIEFEVN